MGARAPCCAADTEEAELTCGDEGVDAPSPRPFVGVNEERP